MFCAIYVIAGIGQDNARILNDKMQDPIAILLKSIKKTKLSTNQIDFFESTLY
jgi:hypothetical protein